MLIRRGANANAVNLVGSTPLHYAAGSGHVDALETLVEAGADVNKRNKEVWG